MNQRVFLEERARRSACAGFANRCGGVRGVAVAAVLAVVCALPADAGVAAISLQKGGFFEQTARKAPPTIDGFVYLFGLGSGPGEVGAASVSFGGLADPIALFEVTTGPGGEQLWGAGASFNTQADLDAAVPSTNTTFEISGGSLGTASADVDWSVDLYPNSIPQFDPVTFDGLQLLDPSSDFTLSFNGFTPSPDAAIALTGILFSSLDGSDAGAIVAPTATDTEIIIPAGTLLPNKDYSLGLTYQQAIGGVVVTPGPFQGALTLYNVAHLTSATFRTVPEPGASTLLAVGLAVALRRRRPAMRREEV